MFSLRDYYLKAHLGQKVDNTDMLDYIRSYEKIVLWGASYLGEAIGKFLIDNDITIYRYWDLRWETIHELNGITCTQPFEDQPSA